jgi:hypothetical protein
MTFEERVEKLQNESVVYRFLLKRKSHAFAVGDYVVRQYLRNDKWYTSRVGGDYDAKPNALPLKFKVVLLDMFGVPFLKRVKLDNTLGEEVIYLDDVSYDVVFRADPDYLDHLLLTPNNEFEPYPKDNMKERKKRNQEINAYNDKMKITFASEDESWAFFSKMPLNTKFWHGLKETDGFEFLGTVTTTTNSFGSVSCRYIKVKYVNTSYPPQQFNPILELWLKKPLSKV